MHGNFLSITLDAGKLNITGINDNIETVSSISAAVIAVNDPGKRAEARTLDPAVEKVETQWDTDAPAGAFEDGDVVILVGAVSHTDDGPNPFLWHGRFKLGKPDEVQLVVEQ